MMIKHRKKSYQKCKYREMYIYFNVGAVGGND